MTLEKTIKNALEKMKSEGIEGWGLNNPDETLFETVVSGPATGCTTETCNHFSHDPAASYIKLVPQFGKLSQIGSETQPDESEVSWYILVDGEGVGDADVRYLRLGNQRSYWSTLLIVESEEVPAWALASLATA